MKDRRYYRDRQGEEKAETATAEEMASTILEILKHHDKPISWNCIMTNIEGSEHAYKGLCLLLERKQIKREWSTEYRFPRKVFRIVDTSNSK